MVLFKTCAVVSLLASIMVPLPGQSPLTQLHSKEKITNQVNKNSADGISVARGEEGGIRSVNSTHLINPMFRIITLHKPLSPTMWRDPLFNLALHPIPEIGKHRRIFLMDIVAEFFPATQCIVERHIFEFGEDVD